METRKICYIDDSRTSSFVTKKMLQQEGFDVDHFSTAEDAIDAILTKSYAVVITDLMISSDGGVNGDDLIHLIRHSGHPLKSSIPIIVVTGAGDLEIKQELMAAGANNVLNKPLKQDQLAQAIASVTELMGTKASYSIDDPDPRTRHEPVETVAMPVTPSPPQPKTRGFDHLRSQIESQLFEFEELDRQEQKIPTLTEAVEKTKKQSPQQEEAKAPDTTSASTAGKLKTIKPKESVVDIPLIGAAHETTKDEPDVANEEAEQGKDFTPVASPYNKPNRKHDSVAFDDLTVEDLMFRHQAAEDVTPDSSENVVAASDANEMAEDSEFDLQKLPSEPDYDTGFVETLEEETFEEEAEPKKSAPAEPANPLLALLDHLDKDETAKAAKPLPDFAPKPRVKINITPRMLKAMLVAVAILVTVPSIIYFAIQETTVEVDFVTVEQGPIHESIQVSGRVVSRKQIEVTSFFPGQLISVDVKEGSQVRKGQILARLDDREIKSEVNRAEAKLISIQESVALASKTMERYQKALDKGAVSRQMVEDAEAAWKSESAKQALAEEELKQAKLKQERLSIAAPFDGLVSSIETQAGQWLAPPAPLLKLVDMNSLEIELKVDTADSTALRENQIVEMSSDAFPGTTWEEEIVRIASTTNREASANLVSVFVSLKEDAPKLRVGQQVDARVRTASNNRALKVPFEAIVTRNGQTMVMVQLNERVHFVPVVTGLENFSHVEITQGLSLGQTVLLPGGLSLEEGQKISIVDR